MSGDASHGPNISRGVSAAWDDDDIVPPIKDGCVSGGQTGDVEQKCDSPLCP